MIYVVKWADHLRNGISIIIIFFPGMLSFRIFGCTCTYLKGCYRVYLIPCGVTNTKQKPAFNHMQFGERQGIWGKGKCFYLESCNCKRNPLLSYQLLANLLEFC